MELKYPKGKYMAMVRVGEKGQIVIPKPARDMFAIQSGDTLLLLADEERGIAIISPELHEFPALPELWKGGETDGGPVD